MTRPPASQERVLPGSDPPHAGDHLYIHVPFCLDRCTYCAFTTIADDTRLHGRFAAAIACEARRLQEGAQPRTISFGGGTPGLLPGELISSLLRSFRPSSNQGHSAEITLEANPANVCLDRLQEWAECGVNRLSIGVQTFDNRILKSMARLHDGDGSRAALQETASHWARSWSADLLVGWHGQTERQLLADLDELLAFEPPHVSVYGLTIEPGTPLARLASRGRDVVADPETSDQLDAIWTERLEAAGLHRYEVSNFARPGHECRHNQAYWHGHAYRGLGPGASSSVGRLRWTNRRSVSAWMNAAESGAGLREHVESLTADQRLLELLASGLRTARGLSPDQLDARFSPSWRGPFLRAAAPHLERGLLEFDADRLGIAAGGLSRADRILVEIAQRWPSEPAAGAAQ